MAAMNIRSASAANYPLASLYVDNLDPNVTETMLFDKFASAGPILSIQICRNAFARRSLGCAYVNFQQPADAERTFDTMNFDLLRGRPLGIMWSERDPALLESGAGGVFIKNLDKNIDNKSLYDTFSAFGNILSFKIMIDETGQSKGFGFIHFETQEAARTAIIKSNRMLLGDKEVYVGHFIPHNHRADLGESQKFRNIFIKNFGDQINQDQLIELFSKYGQISDFIFGTDENGYSEGCALCGFEKPEEAEEAVKNLNGYSVGDKQLYVGRFTKKNGRLLEIKPKTDLQKEERMSKYEGVNLYIKNLDDTIDEERLRAEFSKFGTITSATVMSENGRSKGFGFVCFSTPDEATKAVTEMNGTIVGTKPLYVALAQRKEERRMDITYQHMQRIATSRVAPQMQLPFPNGMGGMMSYLPGPMDPSQPRNYFPQTAMPQYRAAQPRWSSAATTGGMRPQPNPQMIGMKMPSSAMAAARRSAMVNAAPRGGMPMQTRPINHAGFSGSIIVAGQELLTPAGYTNATPQEQKQILGERLFPLIQQMQPELAGKITGMLLEIDNTELLHMLQPQESLKVKVEEAIAVLQAHQDKQLDAAKEAATNSDAT